MPADLNAADEVLAQCARGSLSPEMALRNLVASVQTMDELALLIEHALQRPDGEGDASRVAKIVALYAENREGCAKYLQIRMLGRAARARTAGKMTVADMKALFDSMVEISERVTSSSICLDSADILRRQTEAFVEILDGWNLLQQGASVLQIACGNGRFEAMIASRVGQVYGIDISPRMLEAARRNCAGLPNVHLTETSGNKLAFADGSFDLVYSVDSFPFVFDEGIEVVDDYFREAHRVLKPAGHFVILGFSARNDDALDRKDAGELAARHGFEIVQNGEKLHRDLFSLCAFHFEKVG